MEQVGSESSDGLDERWIEYRCHNHHTNQAATLDDPDPLQLAFHIDHISSDTINILQALESNEEEDFKLPSTWLHNATVLPGNLVNQLQQLQKELVLGKFSLVWFKPFLPKPETGWFGSY